MTSRATDEILRATVGGGLAAHGDTVKLTVTAVADVTAALTEGQTYEVKCTSDMHLCANSTGVADATTDDMIFYANEVGKCITIPATHLYVSAVRSSADGVLYLMPINDRVV